MPGRFSSPMAVVTATGFKRPTALVRYSRLVPTSKPSASKVALPSGRRSTAFVACNTPLVSVNPAVRLSTCCARKAKFVAATDARNPVNSRSRHRPQICPSMTGVRLNSKYSIPLFCFSVSRAGLIACEDRSCCESRNENPESRCGSASRIAPHPRAAGPPCSVAATSGWCTPSHSPRPPPVSRETHRAGVDLSIDRHRGAHLPAPVRFFVGPFWQRCLHCGLDDGCLFPLVLANPALRLRRQQIDDFVKVKIGSVRRLGQARHHIQFSRTGSSSPSKCASYSFTTSLGALHSPAREMSSIASFLSSAKRLAKPVNFT